MIDEKDPVIINLRAQEKQCRDHAKMCDQQASDARNKCQEKEREATDNYARADKFKAAIASLGA